MSVLNLINKKELLYQEMLDELKVSNLENIFYGTSDAAKKFYDKFKNSKINIDKVIVSPSYYKENTYFFELKVLNSDIFLNEIRNNTDVKKKNVIVFFGIDDNLLKKLHDSPKINKIFLVDGGVCFLSNFQYEYIEKRDKEYTKTFNLLEDELSKNIMIGFINARISGYSDDIRKYTIDESYFPKDVIKLENDEIFLDCGAFDGDTIEIFKKYMRLSNKTYLKIYGFEPDKENFKKLKMNNIDDEKVVPLNIGVFNKKDILSFCSEATGGSNISKNGTTMIEVDKIDNLITKDNNVTFIKMDLEGAEKKALEGARDTILKYKPKLAIAVYHKIEDLIEIPEYIKSLVPEYKFYLRAQCYDTVDVTLFAVIE